MLDKNKENTDTHNHGHNTNRFAVIPTAEKLNASRDFAGRGITIAFLDSGFYFHPDIADRVVAFHDVSGEETKLDEGTMPDAVHWHGTQTAVSCAGDGRLSDGIYKGLASEASLVLVKVSKNGAISEDEIELGLRWVLENREKYRIRLLNISLGGDQDVHYAESKINHLAEECVKQGITVFVAAGNSPGQRPIPPANAPSVITVGGYNDQNSLMADDHTLYHSSYGATAGGGVKPELVAPAMFVAAPILPNTNDYAIAELLSEIADSPDYKLRQMIAENWYKVGLQEEALFYDANEARKLVEDKLMERKIVATHYQHVDGTSFASPIAASLGAQMLEANPGLTPAAIKNLLVSTASRLSDHSAIRQGYGRINASAAIEEAIKEIHFLEREAYSPPLILDGEILFFYHDDYAHSVALAGDFNDWNSTQAFFIKQDNGIWRASIDALEAGSYKYKFVVNGISWIDDSANWLKEEDGFGGFNSILNIG